MSRIKYKFLNELDLSTSAIQNLSRNLDGIVKGNDHVIKSPILKRLDPDQILKDWLRVLYNNNAIISEELKNLEDSNISKFGPRSIAIPWKERKSMVYDYFKIEHKQRSLSDHPYEVYPNTRRLRPISEEKAISFIKNNTNSGLPYVIRKGLLKDYYSDNLKELLSRKDPCVLFTRTQEGKKTRAVWGYPMADTINEMRFYRPLLEHQKKTGWRSAVVGPSATDRNITKIIDSAVARKKMLMSVDFSSYDASVKFSLQKYAFEYIKSLFQDQYRSEIDDIFKRFNTIGLITPDGILESSHGVPSGSTFTNEVDSIVQFILAKQVLKSELFDIQGDDAVYPVGKVSELENILVSNGLKLNKEKSYVSPDFAVYLQKLYSIHYRDKTNGIIGGIYPTIRALCRILFPERFEQFGDDNIKGVDYFSIRTISILENCKHHPLFEEFVRYVKSLDKYNLYFSKDGLSRYIKRSKESSGVEDIIKNQYGEDVSGIYNFAAFKILMKC